jgi:UrcA family protein
MKTLKLIALTTVLVATSFACAVPAAAETLSETVNYSDLDIDTPAGAAALYSRLEVAARHVCRALQSPGVPFQMGVCRQQALDGAVKNVNRPNLSALHEGRAAPGLTAQR